LIAYRIRDWKKHFEKADSRLCKTMNWVPLPVRHDGAGFNRVARHEKNVDLFCAWILIVEVAAKMPVRGTLVKDGRALDSEDLYFRTWFPKQIFDLAFSILTKPEIGWLERFEYIENEDLPQDYQCAGSGSGDY
jgi:hypothetical protein